MTRYALLQGLSEGTESRILTNIRDGLKREGVTVKIIEGQSQLLRASLLRKILGCDVLIVHTPLVYAAFYVLFARMLGKKVVGLVWDHYPVTLAGRRYDTSLRRKFLDLLENLAIAMCSHLIVPSSDFLEAGRLMRAQVVPFWFPVEITEGSERPPEQMDHGGGQVRTNRARIIFAGQVNATRGLEEAHAELEAHFGKQFELIVASRDALPHSLQGKHNVKHLGFLGRDGLRREMARCDAGLVSLSHDFGGPSLPSKTWEYLSAGLKCIFVGKRLPHYTKALTGSDAGIVLSIDNRGTLKSHDLSGCPAQVGEAARRFSAHFELDSAKLAAHLRRIAEPTWHERLN